MTYKVFIFNGDCYDIRFCNYDAVEREEGEFVLSVLENKDLADEIAEALNDAYKKGLKAGRE